VNCGGSIPANAQANGASDYTQTWNDSAWTATKNWTYNTTNGECNFTCKSNYTRNGNSCVVCDDSGTSCPTGKVAVPAGTNACGKQLYTCYNEVCCNTFQYFTEKC
jgi:hypothetical protein